MMENVLHSTRRNEYIPFFEIVLPYTKYFLDGTDTYLSTTLRDKLQFKLLEELSVTSEITIQHELDSFTALGNSDFYFFVEKVGALLASMYPVLDESLKTKTSNFTEHISKIVSRFQKDRKNIIATFGLNIKSYNLKITDIDTSIGDNHNGEGTALITLSDGTNLIYKPRNVDVTNSYNAFIDWVNFKLNIDLKTFKILSFDDYGWLEFVKNEEIHSECDLKEYYNKAGILLAVVLLLGSKDCHRENVIVSGKNPILIDHETIIQPFLKNQSVLPYDYKNNLAYFTVLENLLIANPDTAIPKDCVGYGVRGLLEVAELNKKVINPNTIKSKRVVFPITRRLVDKNIPMYNRKYIFVNEYKECFLDGFSATYNMLLNSIAELKSDESPINFFKGKEVRYVWRPTFVYYRILKYLRAATFMSSFDVYNSKLYELLSKAYKSEQMNEYKFILDLEMKQMLNGDIPIFSHDSLANILEGNNVMKIFEYNCIENIYHRLDLLSPEHKEEQLKYINRWMDM